MSLHLVLLVALAGNAFCSNLNDDYESLQKKIKEFNDTTIKELEEKMLKNEQLKDVTPMYIRAITTTYSTILQPLDEDVGKIFMTEYGKWYFQEVAEFLEDKIATRVGNDKDLQKTVEKCFEEMQLLKERSTTLFVLYAQEHAVQPVFDFTNTKMLLDFLGSGLKIPDTIIGIIAEVGMNFVTK